MRTLHPIPSLLLGLGLATAFLQADTLVVFPGTVIQAKIDEAQDGDIIAILGGHYDQDVTVNKEVRLVELQGQDVTITGNVLFDGVADCPPFEGFNVGSPNKGITVRDTTGLTISGVTVIGEGVTVEGESKVSITTSNLSKVRQDQGLLNASNVTVENNFSSETGAAQTVIYRCTINEACELRSRRAWFGYSKARHFSHIRDSEDQADNKVVIVGSEIDARNAERDAIQLSGNNKSSVVSNNVIRGVRSYYTFHENCIEISGSHVTAKIFNNYLLKTHHSSDNGEHHVVYVHGGISGTVVIANNAFSSHSTADGLVFAPFGVTVSNNHNMGGSSGDAGGVVVTDTTTGDPLFVDNDPYKLGEGSPLINAGTPNPLYNDRDGSRNDIGPSGGSWYDPEGWTTDNPVVISFELSSDFAIEGVDTELTVDEVKAVSAP